MRNVSHKSCRENQNTHFMFNNFFRKKLRLGDYVEKCGTARQVTEGNIIWRMRIACWITKTTNTHSEYVILVVFPLQQWLRERVSMLLYTYIAAVVNLSKGRSYMVNKGDTICEVNRNRAIHRDNEFLCENGSIYCSGNPLQAEEHQKDGIGFRWIMKVKPLSD